MQQLPEDAWDAWSPDELLARLGLLNSHWYVVGGWALDLWHGRQIRMHDDLEFAVLPDHVDLCRELLRGLEFFAVSDGRFVHQPLKAELPPDVWQLWGADMVAGCWRVDMMLERGTPETWVYKRDPLLRMPRASAIRKTAGGIPYLAPALVLLFKSRHHREKDERDFRAALPNLTAQEKADLRQWLQALHPGHVWIAALSAEGG